MLLIRFCGFMNAFTFVISLIQKQVKYERNIDFQIQLPKYHPQFCLGKNILYQDVIENQNQYKTYVCVLCCVCFHVHVCVSIYLYRDITELGIRSYFYVSQRLKKCKMQSQPVGDSGELMTQFQSGSKDGKTSES